MTNLTGFGLSAAINGAVALLVLSIFVCARRRPANKFVYAPRTLLPQFRQGRPEPPPLPASWLSWVATVWTISRDEFVAYAGLDAYMFCRFCMLCTELFAAMTILGVGILVPVNYTGQNGGDGFDAISMTNIPENSSRLAAHVIVAYCFAAWTYWQLWRCWGEYAELRLAYMAQEHLHNRSLTLLVQNIPRSARSDAAFLATFRSFFPHAASVQSAPLSPRSARSAADVHPGRDSVEPHFIHSAYVAKDTGDMADHIEARDEALVGMEKAVAAYRDDPSERPTTATKLFCLAKKDALEHWEEELHKNNALLAEERSHARTAKAWSNGFITFDSVMAYQSALRVDATGVPFEWECRPAPELRDVYWPNLAMNAAKRVSGRVLSGVLLWSLVIFWLIPVAFIQSLANLSTLPEKVHFLSFINSIPSAVLGIIDGYLPPLVLVVFNIVLPKILAYFTKLQGVESVSRIQRGVLRKYSIFWVLNYLIFSTVATSIFNKLSGLLNHPSSIVTLLGQSIPNTSTFFITYLLFQTFSVYPMMLLNPGGLVVGWLKKRFTVKVPRDVVKIEAAPAQDYGTAYPLLVFAFVIAVTFAVLAPIVLPFAALYFFSAFVCYKYKYIYYYNTAFETGGQFWPVVHFCLVWSLFVGQVVLTLLLALKKAPIAAALSAPLILAPWLWLYVVRKAYLRRTQLLPLDIAVHIDSNREQRRLMRHHDRSDPQLKARSKAFLDEASNLRNLGYDCSELRAMRQDDITMPHNTPSQRRTEKYHAATLREQRAVIDGKKPPPAGEPASPASEAAAQSDPAPSDVDADADGAEGEMDESGVAALRAGGPLPLQANRSSLSLTDAGMVEYRSAHALLDRALQAAAQLGPLLPPQDYIQPALLVPAELPVPRTMPAVTRDDSLAHKPQLYDEITEEGLERHAGGKQKAAPPMPGKQTSGLNGAASGTDNGSADASEADTDSLILRHPEHAYSAAPHAQQPQHHNGQHAAQQPPATAPSAANGQVTAGGAEDPNEIVVHR